MSAEMVMIHLKMIFFKSSYKLSKMKGFWNLGMIVTKLKEPPWQVRYQMAVAEDQASLAPGNSGNAAGVAIKQQTKSDALFYHCWGWPMPPQNWLILSI